MTRIGNCYKILKFLGKGGFGVTYLAQDTRLEDNYLCVVKHLTNSQAIENFRDRTKREASILRDLGNNHPQIPAFLDYIEEAGNIYLVQQYIAGTSLQDELSVNFQWNEQQVKELLENILLILKDVHSTNIIHRDIKPSNFIRREKDGKIVLIDFGLARVYQPLLKQNILTMGLGTPGYSAPEQWNGNPKFCSDIYSVGIIAIQALIGSNPTQEEWPRDENCQIIWREKSLVSDYLANIIDRMTAFHFNERYQTVNEVLEALANLAKPVSIPTTIQPTLKPKPKLTWQPIFTYLPKWKLKNSISYSILGLGTIILVFFILKSIFGKISTLCPVSETDFISCGGVIIDKSSFSYQKKQAIEAYKQGNYPEALRLFEQVRKQEPNEAEILIYINNLKLLIKKTPVYTIAVSLPLSDYKNSADAGQEILRGVAQAQKYINEKNIIKGYGLQVVIADDNNQADRATDIAQKLGKSATILGVIGNYSSDVIRKSLPIYQQHQLILISPSFVSENLSNNKFLFKIASSYKLNAEKIAEYLKKKNIKKIAIFYDSNKDFTQSYKKELEATLKLQELKISTDEIQNKDFDAVKIIKKLQNQGIQALILIPDSGINKTSFKNSLDIIAANQNKLLLIGSDTLYNFFTKSQKKFAEGMIIPIPWHPLNNTNQTFSIEAKQLWRGEETANWRTAMGYDATLTLAQGIVQGKLSNQQERIKLQGIFKAPNFKVEGVTGEISFTQKGEREKSIVQLVTVVAAPCLSGQYNFVPLEKAGLKTCHK